MIKTIIKGILFSRLRNRNLYLNYLLKITSSSFNYGFLSIARGKKLTDSFSNYIIIEC